MPRRLFSQFIHIRTVYSLSELLGATIARPNAILLGAIVSFLFTLTTYLLAKNYGYTLSGFEAIGAFIVGWAIGILFDICSLLLKRK